MIDPPTGRITLVFTDVEASTVLWDQLPEVMGPALRQHDQVMRQGLEANGGYEVKTEGDAFMVAFSDPIAATRWCLDVQRALHELDWPEDLLTELVQQRLYEKGADPLLRGLRVRMGIHLGTPESRLNNQGRMDYFGAVVNRAARLCAAGHGGQILVSEAVWEAIGPAQLGTAVDLGDHGLKGLSQSERITQLLPESLAERAFPALRSTNPVEFDLLAEEPAKADGENAGALRLLSVLSQTLNPQPGKAVQNSEPKASVGARLVVLGGPSFPPNDVRKLAVKHDLSLIRMESLEGLRRDDLLLVDGSEAVAERLELLRAGRGNWSRAFWVSFHEPEQPIASLERLSPVGTAELLETALFGSELPVEEEFERVRVVEDPAWVRQATPQKEPFRWRGSSLAIAGMAAAFGLFWVLTMPEPLDVELPETPESLLSSGGGYWSNRAMDGDRSSKSETERVQRKQAAPTTGEGQPSIIVYGAEWCGACKALTCWLEKEGLKYSSKDVDKDKVAAAAFRRKARQGNFGLSVPLTDLEGTLIMGFNRRRITEELKRLGYELDSAARKTHLPSAPACRGLKPKELQNWKRPSYSLIAATKSDPKDRVKGQPAPFDQGPMRACLKKLGKKGKRRFRKHGVLEVTLRIGVMATGRIAAVAVQSMTLGSRGYKSNRLAACLEGAIVGQTYPLRPKTEPYFVTESYRLR